MALKVGDPGVEIQEFLGSLEFPETELAPLLLSCGTVRLFDEIIAAGGRDHLLMVDLLKRWKLSDGGPVTGQFVGADRLWDVEFAEEASQERSCRFGIWGWFKEVVTKRKVKRFHKREVKMYRLWYVAALFPIQLAKIRCAAGSFLPEWLKVRTPVGNSALQEDTLPQGFIGSRTEKTLLCVS